MTHHDTEVARLRFIFITAMLTAILAISAINLVLNDNMTAPEEVDLTSIENRLDTLSTKIDSLENKLPETEEKISVTLSADSTSSLNYEPLAILYHGNYVYTELNNSVVNRYSFDDFLGGTVSTYSSAYELGYVGGDFFVRLGYVYVNRGQKLYQYTWENFLDDTSHVGDPYKLSYTIDSMFYKDEVTFLTRDSGTVIYKYDWNTFLNNGNPESSYDLGFVPDSMFYYNGYVYVADGKTMYKYIWGDFNSVF